MRGDEVMDKLFITVKDRPVELSILCKSLLHSDMRNYINEVIFLDDHSEDILSVNRIFSSFSYILLQMGIRTRFLEAKDGRSGINQSLDRVRYYPSNNVWILNGDMLVFSNYFSIVNNLHSAAIRHKSNNGKRIIVSGFNTPLHPPIETRPDMEAIVTKNVGGCSILTKRENMELLLDCFSRPTMTRGWDLHIGEVFDKIYVTRPSQSQHIGIFSGLNVLNLSGFPGAWADI